LQLIQYFAHFRLLGMHTALVDSLFKEMPPVKEAIAQRHPYGGGRLGKPEEIAQACVFLASDSESSWMTGVCLPIDGGFVAQ
jgi:NAD(P)-dependent dehydrogenase (short-subunit alcohol dehydrogenase family)